MAQLRKVVRSNPISNFDQKGPQGGMAFDLLAASAQTLYERMAPAAMEKMKASGEEEGRRAARSQIGETGLRLSTKGIMGVTEAAKAAFGSLEQAFGGPLRVISSFRDPETNARVGGAKNSQHMHGNAFDIDVSGMPQSERTELIRKARAAGFRGIGVYDNTLHFDVGPDRAWGPSHGRDSLPDWAKDAVASPVGSLTISSKSPDTTMVRTSEGKLEPRMYSPYAGEILQAHNIAAGVAYQSEMLNQGQVDLMSISQEFPLNPEGFVEAAREYVDSVVEGAPETFRSDLRGSLEREVQRRFLGVLDEKHRDIRQRADNSSRALMERWSNNYAEALASGNDEEASAARSELESVLRARETLPGSAWTPEQSANVLMDSERAAQRLLTSQRSEVTADLRDRLDTITKAARNGQTAADEAILMDPLAQVLLPEEWAEAQAFVTLRNQMPEFQRMTPGEQTAAIAEMRANPVQMDFEIDLLGAAERAASENARLWEEDPIARAGEVLENRPPELPDFSPETANQFVAAMAARGAYARGLVEDGYVDFAAYLTDAEAQSLGAVFSEQSPPEVRAAMAGSVVAALGRDAVKVFDEMKVDPVTRYAGKIMAVGGDATLAREALVGQQMIAEGLAVLPSKAGSLASFSPDVVEALAGLPSPVSVQAEIMPFAKALYAARSQGVQPDGEDATALLTEAVNASLGQATNKRGLTTGGVQDVGGYPTLLPLGMTVEQFTQDLGVPAPAGSVFRRALGPLSTMQAPTIDTARWQTATGSVPHWGGQPMTPDMFADGRVRYVAVGQNMYRMEVVSGSSVTDVVDEAGNVLMFDPMRLREAAQ